MSCCDFKSVDLKFGDLPLELSGFQNSKYVILSIPYEQTTSYKCGTKEGPMAIIEASRHMELYDEEFGQSICNSGIHTIGEIPVDYSGPKNMMDKIYKSVKSILNKEKVLISLGGEHSITSGIVKAHKELYPNMSVLQLDAHADLRQSFEGTEFSHASAIRKVLEYCPAVQVGIRSISEEEASFLKTTDKTKIFFAKDIFRRNFDKYFQEIADSLSNDVYITIDLDVLDPSIMPGVGTPEPGGMGWYEILDFLKFVAGRKNIIGIDVVELMPLHGNISSDFLAAKLIYKLMAYIDNKNII